MHCYVLEGTQLSHDFATLSSDLATLKFKDSSNTYDTTSYGYKKYTIECLGGKTPT